MPGTAQISGGLALPYSLPLGLSPAGPVGLEFAILLKELQVCLSWRGTNLAYSKSWV